MNAPETPLTLPGTIPGLLRFGSPVRSATDPARVGVVVGTGSSRGLLVWWCMAERAEWCPSEGGPVALDLSESTGRAHAAWWIEPNDIGPRPATNDEEFALYRALHGEDMSAGDIATLRGYAIRLAGVAS